MIRGALLAATMIVGGNACEPTESPTPPIRPNQVITIGEEYEFQIDARRGDRIDLVMNPDGNQLERCNHSGGELIYSPWTLLWICEGVDF